MSYLNINYTKKYIRVFILGIQSSMEYRINFLLTIFSALIPIVIQYFLWDAIYKSSSKLEVYGYTFVQMITYTVLAAIFSKLLVTGFEWDVANDIKNGGLSKFIVQPIGYLLYRISMFIGGKLINTITMIILATSTLFILKFYLGIQLGLERVAFLITILFLALLLNFLIFFCISTLAFWMQEIWQMFVITRLAINIASGGVFPLDIFGPTVLKIVNFLPFKYTIYFPISVVNGKLSSNDLIQGILVQLVWIIVLFFTSNFLWNKGMKKYVAFGG